MRIAIKHYDGTIQYEDHAAKLEAGEVIIRPTEYGPMRFRRSGEIDGVPLFTIPAPGQGEELEAVWSGGELLDSRETLPDTRWETLGIVLFGDRDDHAA